ncbi:unnamed protein product (macronuclear) [Paramecium tetraurelia]|uniref:Uncharacterized protein n=1 Tax=Paramecium tetraurelia TaxID=5888 RepID=A0ECJ0_PARTE|nr:uncharacterized protein GSPATT00003876001 [Paramecium tetraurelia]CAK93007.1 unnamed protein product [Paramecium tetraurelia]|eukprot:XP_001460404.1 hypothetical protein (macronuclear) [Paramecium tetraurelia strain d4-2]
MHQRMKSDIRFDQLKLDYLQGNSSKILKSEQDSTQPSQTQIFQGNLLENKTDRQLSPLINSNRQRHKLKQCQSLALENDPDLEEFSIWGDLEELPVGNAQSNHLISFLELYKYRYEKTTKKPVSCYNVILMTKKLINRHSIARLKYYGINKIQWIDFRDWSRSGNLNSL